MKRYIQLLVLCTALTTASAFADNYVGGVSVYNQTSDTDNISFDVSDFCLGSSGDISRGGDFHYRSAICENQHLVYVWKGGNSICNFNVTLSKWPGIVVTGSNPTYNCTCTNQDASPC